MGQAVARGFQQVNGQRSRPRDAPAYIQPNSQLIGGVTSATTPTTVLAEARQKCTATNKAERNSARDFGMAVGSFPDQDATGK